MNSSSGVFSGTGHRLGGSISTGEEGQQQEVQETLHGQLLTDV